MIGVRVYAAPLPGGGVLLAIPPAALRDLGALGRLLAAHPDRLRIDVLAPRAVPLLPEEAVLTLVRRAACAATFAPAGTAAPRRFGLPALRGGWYVALVGWGWLTLLAAGQSVATVLGGLWLALGLPWLRGVTRRRTDAEWAIPANWLAAAIAGAGVRTLEHAGLSRLAETMAGVDHPEGTNAQVASSAAASASSAFRRAVDACAAAGVPELAPCYAALAAGRRPDGVWTSVTPAAAAWPAGDWQTSGWEVSSPAPIDEPAGRVAAAAAQPEPETRRGLL